MGRQLSKEVSAKVTMERGGLLAMEEVYSR